MEPYATAGALVVVGVIYALDRFGLLPKKRSAADAEAELALRDRIVSRLQSERDSARRDVEELRQTRSFEPILAQIHENAELQAQVLQRLTYHNGAFQHMETSLRELSEGLKLVTGFIAGLVELPIKQQKN